LPAAQAAKFSRRLRQAMVDAITRLGDAGGDHAALTIERAANPIAPARMACQYATGAERQQALALYERCLARYRAVVPAPADAPALDDVGAAVARFVAANLRALRGVEPSPQALLNLERQLIGIVRASPGWAGVPARERQFYFEQMAIVAVLIDESVSRAASKSPDALANVQHAARGYLQHFLGLAPDLLTLGPDGLQAV
jgi:hypothetical protein